ncbi:YoaK family protein [Enterococcus timonensis]|uniref:YoaK family protein n=1 Tax=Enterococcus timonensis TaxID=1852364 RepID=UPI0019684EB0|nr:YoaK family protein [Enterococcus timonensis]
MKKLNPFHEKRKVGLLLTFLGGAMDGYTYIHYDVFASAQTGNLVLAIIQGSNGQWGNVLKKLLSTLFFFGGILLAKFLKQLFDENKVYYWRLYVLFYEAAIFAFVGLSAINIHPALVTVIISFSASIQWISFDKIDGRAYTNLFTTGNLKGMTVGFYDYFVGKKQEAKDVFYHYLWVVVAFILGVVTIVFVYHQVDRYAVFLISALFLYLAVSQTWKVWKFYHQERPIISKK